jgi:DNA-binding transcriptional LysR family regulator
MNAECEPRIAEAANEKQTIVNLVAAGLGAAVVPRWTSHVAISGLRFVALKDVGTLTAGRLPLAVVCLHGWRDPTRDAVLGVLMSRLSAYAESAYRVCWLPDEVSPPPSWTLPHRASCL